MPSKKTSPDKNTGQSTDEPRGPGLDDLEAHISQRMVELENASTVGEPSIPGSMAEDSHPEIDNVVPPFDHYEGFEYPELAGATLGFTPGYERVRESYQDSGEILKSIHNLSDVLTESIVNLNVRLSELESKLHEINEINRLELNKLKTLLMKDVHKAIPDTPQAEPPARAGETKTGSPADSAIDLQKQLQPLKDKLDRNLIELGQRLDERQTAYVNVLETRLKVIERVSHGYKAFLNKYFFNLALLVIFVMVIAAAMISNSVDRMSGYVSQQLDALRLKVEQSLQSGP